MTIATGIKAQNLREFREGLLKVPSSSIYHHFWGRLLTPRFDEPEYSNDYAAWAYWALHEKALAERLSAVDPSGYDDLEELRLALVDIAEITLDARESVPSARSDQMFHFLRGKLVVMDSEVTIEHPNELPTVLPGLSTGSVYYHFIDARRRTPDGCDDFCTWLRGWEPDYDRVISRLRDLDPFFSSLKEIRRLLTAIFAELADDRSAPGADALPPAGVVSEDS